MSPVADLGDVARGTRRCPIIMATLAFVLLWFLANSALSPPGEMREGSNSAKVPCVIGIVTDYISQESSSPPLREPCWQLFWGA